MQAQPIALAWTHPSNETGHIAIPAYAPCVVQLLDKTDAGHLTGKTTLSLALTKVQIGGKVYDVQTTDSVQASAARGSGSAKITGGTAAAGALIGALAGGGRGAAIGADREPQWVQRRPCLGQGKS